MKKLTYGLILLGLIALFSAVATAQTLTIPYEGRLTAASGARLGDDTASIKFEIYADPMGGTLLWGPETHFDVPLDNGVFKVQLGTLLSLPSSIFNGANLYLLIEVRGEDLLPLQPIGSVPYALYTVYGPGIASTSNSGFIGSPAVFTPFVCDSVDLVAPSAGYALVEAAGYVNVTHVGGTSSNFAILVSQIRAGEVISFPAGISSFLIPGALPGGGYRYPFSTSRVFTVSAGTNRFYLNAELFTGSSCDVAKPSIKAVFFPTAAGVVAKPLPVEAPSVETVPGNKPFGETKQ